MSEEQIKQNAEKCARLVLMPHQTLTDEYKGRYDGFIAGAHSRDEEIESIKNEASAIMDEACALTTELNKLRDPWISVEDRLPDREKTLTRFSKDVLCALDNGEFYITDYFDYELNRWNSFPDSITHWMPIPQIKKEE